MRRREPSSHRDTRPEIVFKDRVPVIDLATDRCVGYLDSRYVNTLARSNLEFYAEGKIWKILHITKDERVLVLPKDGPEGLMKHIEDAPANVPQDPDALSDGTINFEVAADYLIIHTSFGESVNRTLCLIFDAVLTEQDLIRDTYSNNFGVLIRTPTRLLRDEADTIRRDLFEIHDSELDQLVRNVEESRFPDFEPSLGRAYSKTRSMRLAREALSSSLDAQVVRLVYKAIAEGRIRIYTILLNRLPSPRASKIIEEYTQHLADGMQLLMKSNYIRLRNSVRRITVALLCLNCLIMQPALQIEYLEEKPKCKYCGSGLLSVASATDPSIVDLIRRKRAGSRINNTERTKLGQARRRADLVLSYGRRALIALSVTGIGPQTASTILARMQNRESSFYSDLLSAKIHYLATRELWE